MCLLMMLMVCLRHTRQTVARASQGTGTESLAQIWTSASFSRHEALSPVPVNERKDNLVISCCSYIITMVDAIYAISYTMKQPTFPVGGLAMPAARHPTAHHALYLFRRAL
jgi:hypothetical protein